MHQKHVKYLSRVISGVDLSKASPLWLQEKLRRSGIRSIDPVVDVTNYVLIELGHPMHAFDASIFRVISMFDLQQKMNPWFCLMKVKLR